ncbi:hypothetical protein PAXRUDRAFT_831349 [Paxillus rubicundulus Ve08.2h10]|uniref:Uncharacterized protein n=1 Tax=Paxillus rubicundulus Ve08.2h10 TaxID=930991 RepID=A0A0D0E234_9AGAM|nr:hypothetical protein PAXRUDRAFT_831349 [Paxillus rubicundulus Ve08.2h10]
MGLVNPCPGSVHISYPIYDTNRVRHNKLTRGLTKQEDFIQLGSRAEAGARRTSDIIFDTMSVKKLEDQTSIR